MIPIRGQSRRRRTIALLAIMSFAALIVVGVAQQIGFASARVDVRTLTVRHAAGPVHGLFVAAGHLEGSRSATLVATASSPLAGWIAPVAVPTADGSQLIYSTWRELRRQDPKLSWSKQGIRAGDALGTPSLWTHDFGTGRDRLIDTNSYSAAVRSDGAIAYVRGTDVYRAFENYTADVVVRSPVSAQPVVWSTEPAHYVVAAWAGRTLLAYRIGDGEQLDVLALDGPGRQRLLMAHANLVAVSPDGTQAFIGGGDAETPGSVSVVNIADGTVAGTLELESLDQGIRWAAYGGSWSGDLVAAPTNAGVALFDVAGGTISLRELLKSDPDSRGGDIIEPQFNGDTDHIIARGDTPGGGSTSPDEDGTTALECDLATAACVAGQTEPGRAWLHPAYNPSRPLKGGAS
jgi:hypothetical protein